MPASSSQGSERLVEPPLLSQNAVALSLIFHHRLRKFILASDSGAFRLAAKFLRTPTHCCYQRLLDAKSLHLTIMVRRRGPPNNTTNGQEGEEDARPTRNITGPQSALTDFLASHNISARQIRDDADQRRAAAANSAAANGDSLEDELMTEEVGESSTAGRRSSRHNSNAQPSKKQREEEKTLKKIKSSKAFKKRKKDADESEDDDEIARAIFEQSLAPLPGQMENCEICDKRFTVTPYSVAGPNGGLLCAPCGREVSKQRQGDNPPKKKPRKQTGGIGSRRAVQSRILDGDVGTKSLATLCVHTLAKNVDMADDLGDLPEHLIDKIARLFSKRRLVKPDTLPLFVRPNTEMLHIYDGASLGEQDLMQIFQVAPQLRDLKIRCAIQFKDEVMDYVLSRDLSLERFYLHGANLLSEEKWHEFLSKLGGQLKHLQVYYTDRHFGDDTVAYMAQHSPNLQKLKIENNQKLTNKGVSAIGDLGKLEHLALQLQNEVSSQAIVDIVSKIGVQMQTLSLRIVPAADDTVLQAMHDHCRSLSKLRITDSEVMTDQGFASLFSGWENPPLSILDLRKCRHIDATKPRENENQVGLCSEGFKALMAHSGSTLHNLNIHACRHISQQAFEDVFARGKIYPELTKLEASFCEDMTDFILGSIFRSCPKIKEVNVFGCMKVKEVRVPKGVILVGVPNAQGMITEGQD